MIIHKSHSKTDLIEIINDLDIPIVFSHQDNKADIHRKFKQCDFKKWKPKSNFHNISNVDALLVYLENQNPKKSLSIKEKQQVMILCKQIINYCKCNYDITVTKYNNMRELIDDMDYIKQFGDIPSVRRCCRLINLDPKIKTEFVPLISPQVQKNLDEKKTIKKGTMSDFKIRWSTPENPIVLTFD